MNACSYSEVHLQCPPVVLWTIRWCGKHVGRVSHGNPAEEAREAWLGQVCLLLRSVLALSAWGAVLSY